MHGKLSVPGQTRLRFFQKVITSMCVRKCFALVKVISRNTIFFYLGYDTSEHLSLTVKNGEKERKNAEL